MHVHTPLISTKICSNIFNYWSLNSFHQLCTSFLSKTVYSYVWPTSGYRSDESKLAPFKIWTNMNFDNLFEHDANVLSLVQISFSHHRFVFYRINKFLSNKKKIYKITHIGKFYSSHAFILYVLFFICLFSLFLLVCRLQLVIVVVPGLFILCFVWILTSNVWFATCIHQITFEPQHDKTNNMACVPSEDSGQPGQPPNLIRVFAVHMESWVLSYPLSAQRGL